MPHKEIYGKVKGAVKGFINRPRKMPLEERDKQDIRDIQGKFKRRQQIEALKRKMK